MCIVGLVISLVPALLFFRQRKDTFHPQHGKKITRTCCADLHGIKRTTFKRLVLKAPKSFWEGGDFCIEHTTHNHRRTFSDNEEMVIAEIVRQAYWGGFGFNRCEFLSFVTFVANKGNIDFKGSEGYIRGFLRRHPDMCQRKTSALDLKRAKKGQPLRCMKSIVASLL